AQGFARAADAGEVSHRFDLVVADQAVDDPKAAVVGAAAGSVGHRDKRRAQALQRGHRFAEQCLFRLVCLGGKELERDGGLRLRIKDGDAQTTSPEKAGRQTPIRLFRGEWFPKEHRTSTISSPW